MTVHAAKGLEFPYVFLCGMNEGIFPSRKVRTQQAMEEERRLAFVALTRAEKGLYLSEADGRNFDGTPRYPSRFLLDIDRNLLAFTRPPEEGLIRAARDYIGHSQTYLPEIDGNMAFSVGQRVKHILFGSGTVLDVDMDKGAHVVQFDEMETPRKISFRAKLEPDLTNPGRDGRGLLPQCRSLGARVEGALPPKQTRLSGKGNSSRFSNGMA